MNVRPYAILRYMVYIPAASRWGLVHGCRLVWRGGICWPVCGLLLILFTVWHMVIVGLVWGERYQAFLHLRSEVFIPVQEGVSDQKRQEFFSALQALPFVTRATYITREKALDHMRSTRPDVLGAFEGVSDLRQIPDRIAVRMTSLREQTLLDAFLLDSVWQRVIDPGMFVHGTDDTINVALHIRVVYGVLVSMILMLCALGCLFVMCMTVIMTGDLYQLPLRIRSVRQSGGNEFACALPSIVACSIWGWTAAVGSWTVLAVFWWSLFPWPLRLPVSSAYWLYTFFVIGAVEILLLPLVIGLIGCVVNSYELSRS